MMLPMSPSLLTKVLPVQQTGWEELWRFGYMGHRSKDSHYARCSPRVTSNAEDGNRVAGHYELGSTQASKEEKISHSL